MSPGYFLCFALFIMFRLFLKADRPTNKDEKNIQLCGFKQCWPDDEKSKKLLKPGQGINSNKTFRGFENSNTTTALLGVLRDFRLHFKVFNEFKTLIMLE